MAEHARTRILVVRMGAMGDIVHTLPAVASLKQSLPGARLTWAVDRKWAPLLAGNPYVDRVVAIDRSTWRALRASARDLRAEQRYDAAVDFQGLIKSALAAAVARADRIYGFDRSQLRERWAALFYSHRVRTTAAHVVDRNLQLAAAAGATSVVLSFPLPAGEPEEGGAELPSEPFVFAAPLAGWASKQWPLEYYKDLAARLKQMGMQLVLNGAPAARALLTSVEGARVHVSGLDGMLYALRQAAAVVGVDSGPLHLAAALGKPGVAIYGPTDPVRNGPYGGTIEVLRAPGARTSYRRERQIDPAMREIAPAAVFERLRARLLSCGGQVARGER